MAASALYRAIVALSVWLAAFGVARAAERTLNITFDDLISGINAFRAAELKMPPVSVATDINNQARRVRSVILSEGATLIAIEDNPPNKLREITVVVGSNDVAELMLASSQLLVTARVLAPTVPRNEGLSMKPILKIAGTKQSYKRTLGPTAISCISVPDFFCVFTPKP